MASKLLINELTQERLDAFAASPTHAVLIYGAKESGLDSATKYLLNKLDIKSKNTPNILLSPEDKHITIEQVRSLRSQLKHKSTEGHTLVKVVTVSTIDVMLPDAQNALLKLLEEPPNGVLFVVHAYSLSQALPTIVSRCVLIGILPVSLAQATAHFEPHQQTSLQQNYVLSGGAPKLLTDLVAGSEQNTLVSTINTAKNLLKADTYSRLCQVDALCKDKSALNDILLAMHKVCMAGTRASAHKKPWIHNVKQVNKAIFALKHNVQAKLLLDELLVSLIS